MQYNGIPKELIEFFIPMKTAIQILDEMIEELNPEGFIPSNTDSIVTSYLREAKERIKKETGLISVKDYIPELGVPVITLDIYGTFAVMKRNKIDGWSQPGFGVSLDSITHWMPLPLPPKE